MAKYSYKDRFTEMCRLFVNNGVLEALEVAFHTWPNGTQEYKEVQIAYHHCYGMLSLSRRVNTVKESQDAQCTEYDGPSK